MRPSVITCLLFALTGCATKRQEMDSEARGYERGYQQAVKEQYWVIQNQQRALAPVIATEASHP